jgi:hypothetical protein
MKTLTDCGGVPISTARIAVRCLSSREETHGRHTLDNIRYSSEVLQVLPAPAPRERIPGMWPFAVMPSSSCAIEHVPIYRHAQVVLLFRLPPTRIPIPGFYRDGICMHS